MEIKYTAYHFSYTDMEIGARLQPRTHNFFSDTKAKAEESLEKIRISKYPDYNTRLCCVFLAPTKESALEWCKEINIEHWRNEQQEVSFFLYSVKVREKPIWFDSNILADFHVQNKNIDRISEAYWESGKDSVEPHTTQALEYMTANEVIITSKSKCKINTEGTIIEE